MLAKLLTALACLAMTAALTATARANAPVRVEFGSHEIDLYHSASVRVSGVAARVAEVRLVGAIDRRGLAYEWKPYHWRELRPRQGAWLGLLPAPPLPGIYRVQLRLDRGRRLLSSTRWLLRVFPDARTARRSAPTALGAIRGYVAHLPGHKVLVSSRRWPLATFDHRDPRLNRIYAIAYAPRDDTRPGSRLGSFVTTVRDGYHGRWRVLQSSTQPYD